MGDFNGNNKTDGSSQKLMSYSYNVPHTPFFSFFFCEGVGVGVGKRECGRCYKTLITLIIPVFWNSGCLKLMTSPASETLNFQTYYTQKY